MARDEGQRDGGGPNGDRGDGRDDVRDDGGARGDRPTRDQSTRDRRNADEHGALAQLVRRAQAGDSAAFEELYARTAPVQYFSIVGRVGAEAAPDILQELYLTAWKNIASVKPRAFVGYLNATARNLCRWHFRRLGGTRAPAPVEDRVLEASEHERAAAGAGGAAADPALVAAARDERARLARALLEVLDDQERTAVLLRFYQGMKLDEVARALDVSRATAKRAMARALDKLRAKLGMLPVGAAFGDWMARAVDGTPLPQESWDQICGGMDAVAPRGEAGAVRSRRAVRAVGLCAVAVAVGGVAVAAALPRPEALPVQPASLAAAPAADAEGPALLEARTVDGVTCLRLSDESGVAVVWCESASGARIDASRDVGADAATGIDSDVGAATGAGADVDASAGEWRVSLPNDDYRLHAVDSLGNESVGDLSVDVAADAF